jgi:hypothetical protein
MGAAPTSFPTRPALADLPASRRLALGLFLLGIVGFYGLAQATLTLAVGGGRWPSPADVLHRYHGDPTKSMLHQVLDPSRGIDDPRRMYPFLGTSDAELVERRAAILSWVEAGATREGYAAVRPVFEGEMTCGLCHSTKPDAEGHRRAKADLPFESYEQVLAAARPDRGMPWADLAKTSHNHLFGFLVAALLVSWAFTATRWRGPLVPALVTMTFLGALVDVAAWWATKRSGAPWHLAIMAGGAAFGASLTAMAVLALDELWLRSTLGRAVAAILRPLGLGRLEPR